MHRGYDVVTILLQLPIPVLELSVLGEKTWDSAD